MDSKKHIVICTPGFAAHEDDSTCIPPLQAYVKELSKHNKINLTVISLHYSSKSKYSWHGVEVIAIGANNNKFPFRFISWKKFQKAIQSIHQNHPIDILHSFWATDVAYIAQKAADKLGVEHFITLMGQDVLGTNKYFNRIKPTVNQLICVSDRQAQMLNKHFNKEAVHVIPWGIDAYSISGKNLPVYDVIGVGSLTELKNYSLFVEVIAELHKKGKITKAVLIGDGPEEEKLKQKAKEKGLEEVLQFTGRLNRDEVLLYMEKSKIFLHTSQYESLGYVFQEAISTKTPIVSTPVGMAQEKNYWRIGETKQELAEHTIHFLETTEQYDFEVYSMQQTVEAYLSVYGFN